MKIHFDKLYRDDRTDELCGLGVPFPKGTLKSDNVSSIAVYDGEKRLLSQSKVTSTWEDDSVRFAYVRFLATLPGNKGKDLELVYDKALPELADVDDKLDSETDNSRKFLVIAEKNGLKVTNTYYSFSVEDDSDSLFSAFSFKGKEWAKERFAGPTLRLSDKVYVPYFEKWKVVEEGPVFSVIECDGSYKGDFTGEGLKFTMRLSVANGKPWIDAAFRFFNCTDDCVIPTEISFDIKGSGGKNTSFTGISNYKTKYEEAEGGNELYSLITAERLEQEANEHFAEVFYGTFFADYLDSDLNEGICTTIYQAQQNFPKALKTGPDGIKIFLIPDQDETAKVSKAEPVRFEVGMAREQRFLLHFHDSETDRDELNNRSTIYQMPDVPYIDPEEFDKAGVMPNIFLPYDKQNDEIEMSLIDRADSHPRCYGMLNFGDGPDPGYTNQGRGEGRLVWTNNEYDYPHAMYQMYARSGIRRFFDYARIACLHWMDVDICHYFPDPMYRNGQWQHMAGHIGARMEDESLGHIMSCSHEWVEGLLDHYHFTGDERALEAAIGIGDNVLALLEKPQYQVPGAVGARETGWALRSLTALFVETHDEKWRAKEDWIVGQFKEWKDKYGAFLSEYTDNTTIRAGFMISVAIGSLMRYYRAFPDESVKELIIDAVDDLVENCMTKQGIFTYKELPSLARNGNNTLLLEAMATGYELTGDMKYLQCGLKTFRRAIKGSGYSNGGKRIVEDTLISGNGAPKNFAQSFFPLTYFYTKAVGAGIEI